MAPPPTPYGQQPWGAAPANAAARTGNPWLVALTVGLALVIVALVAVGLRAAAGRSTSSDVVETPARPTAVSPTTDPSSPSTRGSTPSPSTTDPSATSGGPSSTVPKVDTTTPRVVVNDPDGRFQIKVPRSWSNVPTALADQNQWVPFVQQPDGQLAASQFLFAVRWADSGGCALERCTAQVVDRLKAANPGVSPTTTADTIGNLPALRIEAETPDQRLVAWVVVKDDRYWVPQLRGPRDEFEAMAAVVRPVVVAMSFG